MSDRDYYEILGLTPKADGAMVDQAYWHLARKYQTLIDTNPRARYLLDELNEAYGVLGTPRLRVQYDAFRDDVLVQRGMIRPVTSKPKRRERRSGQPDAAAERRLRLPRLTSRNVRTYATAAIIATLGLGAAWSGVNPVLVLVALAAGLAVSLAPVLRRQLPDVSLALPQLTALRAPQMPAMPQMPKLPDFGGARLRELGLGAADDEPLDADELRASTAAMISRWRTSVGLRSLHPEQGADGAPTTELLDIVDGERRIDEEAEPIAAALEILRGSRRPVEMK